MRSGKFKRMHFLAAVVGVVRRVPFTLVTLALVILVTLSVNPRLGNLTPAWMNRLGFAPHDLFDLQWGRLFSSTPVIERVRPFIHGMIMIGLIGGAAEWLAGTRRAITAFWGGNLAALVLSSVLIVWPLYRLGVPFGEDLYRARDVGPSAAYYGGLGLLAAWLPKPWRWIVFGASLGFMGLAIVLATRTQDVAVNVLAALAHVIALPVGFASYWVVRDKAVGVTGEAVSEHGTG